MTAGHEMTSLLKGSRLVDLFDRLTQQWHDQAEAADGAETHMHDEVETLHRHNYSLWHLEDEARRLDVADAVIVQCKRSIDRHNQRRNDAIEAIDLWIFNELKTAPASPEAEMNSETPGSIIDRLSISSLKIYHMQQEIVRPDVAAEHVRKARERLAILQEQRCDLVLALDRLADDLIDGRKRHKLYRQFKMYNDPATNPALYKKESQKQGL